MKTNKNDTAIKVQGLSKRFGNVQAVAEEDFEVKSGELFGFLGPNGAGKTTTINMLIGLARPDLAVLVAFCAVLFVVSLRNIKKRWIV